MTRPEQSKASGPVPPHRYGLPSCCLRVAHGVAHDLVRRDEGGELAVRVHDCPPARGGGPVLLPLVDVGDREPARGVRRRPAEHLLDVPAGVVVGEDRGGGVLLHAVRDEVLGRARRSRPPGRTRWRCRRRPRRWRRRSPPRTPGGRARRPTGCPTRRRCRSASARPRRTRCDAGWSRRAAWSARRRSRPCRCRPGSSTARCTAGRPAGTTSGSCAGSSWPPRWTPPAAPRSPRWTRSCPRRPRTAGDTPPTTSIGTTRKANSSMSHEADDDRPDSAAVHAGCLRLAEAAQGRSPARCRPTRRP